MELQDGLRLSLEWVSGSRALGAANPIPNREGGKDNIPLVRRISQSGVCAIA